MNLKTWPMTAEDSIKKRVENVVDTEDVDDASVEGELGLNDPCWDSIVTKAEQVPKEMCTSD